MEKSEEKFLEVLNKIAVKNNKPILSEIEIEKPKTDSKIFSFFDLFEGN